MYVSNNFQNLNKNDVLDGSSVPQSDYTIVDSQTSRYNCPTVETVLSPQYAYKHVLQEAGAS